MKTCEITFLKCLRKESLIVELEPVFQHVAGDETGGNLAQAVMAAGQALRQPDAADPPLLLDRLLVLDGHCQPLLGPGAFQDAAAAHPQFAKAKMARFFLSDRQASPHDQMQQQGPAQPAPFRYRTAQEHLGAGYGLVPVTLLCKDYLNDSYELTGLQVESTSPAASILQYLEDETDGRLQPVAAFSGSVAWFRPESAREVDGDRQKTSGSLDTYSLIYATLLDEALVRQGFLARDDSGQPSRGLDWLANLLKARALVAVESDLPFAEQTLGEALKSRVPLSLVVMQPTPPPEMTLLFTPPPRPSLVVLPMLAYSQLADPERAAHELIRGEHSALIGTGSLKALPEPIRRIVETTITLPRLDRQVFARLFAAIFGAPPPEETEGENGAWIAYVQPWDLARIARGGKEPQRAYIMLRHRIEDRLARVTPSHGPSLADLHGLGEARLRAEMLIADIQAAVAGRIPWDQVDRGMLLAGPPGCGKTALARAIAKDCGVRFVECSAARWQMAGHLGEHLAAIARDFAEARRFAPSILFIDEIDSIGSREQFSGSNAAYHQQVVNAVLAELQGFSERGKVVIVAATNLVEHVDPALRRAGRLDRVVKVSLPTIAALEKIYEYYLQRHGAGQEPDADIALRPLAEASFGRTGADVSLIVRGALRRARRAGRPTCQDDLLAEIYERPIDRDLDRPLQGEGIRRVAIHEAGHALVSLKAGGNRRQIGYVSIVPRGDGSLGFVALKPDADLTTLTRADYLAHLQVILAGRAAEEVFYGPEGIGSGAGGGEESDLAKATNLALDMVCKLGLGRRAPLLWHHDSSDEDYREAQEMVDEAYQNSRKLLENDRNMLVDLVDMLIANQEISGEELKGLISCQPCVSLDKR